MLAFGKEVKKFNAKTGINKTYFDYNMNEILP